MQLITFSGEVLVQKMVERFLREKSRDFKENESLQIEDKNVKFQLRLSFYQQFHLCHIIIPIRK